MNAPVKESASSLMWVLQVDVEKLKKAVFRKGLQPARIVHWLVKGLTRVDDTINDKNLRTLLCNTRSCLNGPLKAEFASLFTLPVGYDFLSQYSQLPPQ